MTAHDISKALEVWTLQNLLNISILLGILAAGLAIAQDYFNALERHLSLRISIEVWRILTVLVVDILLLIVVLVGYVVLNPDIMADIKIAVPFCPLATLLFAVVLILRLFHGGHEVGSKNYMRSLYLMLTANAINMFGFTIVMETPRQSIWKVHPSAFWEYIKSHLLIHATHSGLELRKPPSTSVFRSSWWSCLGSLLGHEEAPRSEGKRSRMGWEWETKSGRNAPAAASVPMSARFRRST